MKKIDTIQYNQDVNMIIPSHGTSHSRIVAAAEVGDCLDTLQLNTLELSFREWTNDSKRKDIRLSRWRILLIFLLIRYTGAKLNEVLALNPFVDIDINNSTVRFNNDSVEKGSEARDVRISETLSREIEAALVDVDFRASLQNLLMVDPGFVRRKFYERAGSCGFDKKLGGPEMIRKARAIELMQCNLPIPVVQKLLAIARRI